MSHEQFYWATNFGGIGSDVLYEEELHHPIMPVSGAHFCQSLLCWVYHPLDLAIAGWMKRCHQSVVDAPTQKLLEVNWAL